MKVKINDRSTLLGVLTIMPIIDTLSGWITPVGEFAFNIGQVYRSIVFVILFYMYMKYDIRNAKNFIYVILIIFTTQIIPNLAYTSEIVVAIIKMLAPILIFFTLIKCIDKNIITRKDIYALLYRYAILYPMMFIFPKIFNISTEAVYDGKTGYKGLFYAQNEISFVLSTIFMYLVFQLDNKIKKEYIILCMMNVACMAVLGTKSSVLVIIIFFGFFLLKTIFSKTKKKIVRRWITILIAILIGIITYNLLYEFLIDNFNRWIWQKNYVSRSTLDFLSSGRINRIKAGFEIFINNPWYFIFGWGIGLSYLYVNTEMDFFDMLFGLGIINFIIIMIIYGNCLFRKCRILKNGFWNKLIIVTTVILCLFAGHVLYYGQSGMALGILIVFIYVNSIADQGMRADNCMKMLESV